MVTGPSFFFNMVAQVAILCAGYHTPGPTLAGPANFILPYLFP